MFPTLVVILTCLFGTSASGQESSLAEIARKTRQEKGTAPVKRVLTNDDVGGVVDPLVATAQALKRAVDDYLVRLHPEQDTSSLAGEVGDDLERLDSHALAQNVLRPKNLDFEFPGRKDWELRLFKPKEAYVQGLRAAAKAIGEYRQLLEALRSQTTRTQGEEMKLEALRKTAMESADQATRQWRELQQVFQEGWTRAKEWSGQ